jgi:hypothetical protein
MNVTLVKALVLFVPASVLLAYSVAVFVRRRNVSAFLQLAGAACLVVVVLPHVADALHVFPLMQWGEPDSIGHYLDLSSAALGVSLLALAVILRVVSARWSVF